MRLEGVHRNLAPPQQTLKDLNSALLQVVIFACFHYVFPSIHFLLCRARNFWGAYSAAICHVLLYAHFLFLDARDYCKVNWCDVLVIVFINTVEASFVQLFSLFMNPAHLSSVLNSFLSRRVVAS